MSKKDKTTPGQEPEAVLDEQEAVQEAEEVTHAPGPDASEPGQEAALREQLKQQEDKFLRLAAEYDNFRRRSQKEKEAIYADATADAVKALLGVYDNLERALKQETTDEAYKKGVEMTMAGLQKALTDLGVTEIDAVGQSFDPNIHNAVMHIDDESLGENTVAEVFQTGFMLGDKVIRFAMVKVAN